MIKKYKYTLCRVGSN